MAVLQLGALHDAGVAYLNDRGVDVGALEAEIGGPVVGRTPFKAPDQLVTRMREREGSATTSWSTPASPGAARARCPARRRR